jgi:alpha-mannosidase
MEDFPSYTFAASQAQQFEWVEQIYPKLFEKIQDKAKDGQFIPIGGKFLSYYRYLGGNGL